MWKNRTPSKAEVADPARAAAGRGGACRGWSGLEKETGALLDGTVPGHTTTPLLRGQEMAPWAAVGGWARAEGPSR